jgi:hypothetical protein
MAAARSNALRVDAAELSAGDRDVLSATLPLPDPLAFGGRVQPIGPEHHATFVIFVDERPVRSTSSLDERRLRCPCRL